MGQDCVFISYAHEDRQFVEDLADRLTQAGVAAWFDRELTPGGKRKHAKN